MKKILLTLSLLALTFAAYSDKQAKKSIVASFYPVAFMAEQIVGDKAEVINLAGSVDVHSFEPSPQDLVKINKADLVVFQGAELEPWTDGVIPELKAKGVNTLEVTHGLELAKRGGHDDHKDEHKDEHGHKHGEFDPHTWLDPILAQKMAGKILEAVVAIDPTNEKTYQANAKALKDRFAKLDQDLKKGLAQCANEEFIVAHNAYGYLVRRYGFKTHAIAGLSPHDEPSAKLLAELKKEAEEGITHILIEENNIRRFADTLAKETGLATLPANPLGRGTLDPKKDFFDVMEENLASFKTALNCK